MSCFFSRASYIFVQLATYSESPKQTQAFCSCLDNWKCLLAMGNVPPEPIWVYPNPWCHARMEFALSCNGKVHGNTCIYWKTKLTLSCDKENQEQEKNESRWAGLWFPHYTPTSNSLLCHLQTANNYANTQWAIVMWQMQCTNCICLCQTNTVWLCRPSS